MVLFLGILVICFIISTAVTNFKIDIIEEKIKKLEKKENAR